MARSPVKDNALRDPRGVAETLRSLLVDNARLAEELQSVLSRAPVTLTVTTEEFEKMRDGTVKEKCSPFVP